MKAAVFALFMFALGCFAPVQASDYGLDMRNVEIREFIDTIAQITEKTIVVDQRVNGKVDIRSYSKLTEDELYEIFLIQLNINGYSVVDLGNNILKVIPVQSAKSESISVTDNQPLKSSENIVTRIVAVNNVNVGNLIPVLQPLVDSQAGVVTPFADSNVLLITDKASNVSRLLKIIEKIDKSSTNAYEVVRLFNASAKNVETTLNTLLGKISSNQGGPESTSLVVADARINSVILVADTETRRKLKAIIKDLDTSNSKISSTKVFYLKYASAKELLEIIKTINGTAQAAEEAVLSDFRITAHDQTNSLIISGAPDQIADAEAIISQLDIRRSQVLVEAVIVEISENLNKSLGVQWVASRSGSEASSPIGAINFTANSAGIVGITGSAIDNATDAIVDALQGQQGLTLGIGRFSSGGLSFAALVNAVANDSDSNILSTPSLLTMDNEESSILVGQEVPIITGSTTGNNNTNPFQTISRQDVGVKLKVTPQINDGDAILLTIEQEVSSLSGLTASDIIINKRQINTRVLADDGATIVLGGLVSSDVQESSSKVPLLGDLPLIGRAFKSDTSRHIKRNLMVFIKPSILRDPLKIKKLSSEKYNDVRQEQVDSNEDGINLLPDVKGPELPPINLTTGE